VPDDVDVWAVDRRDLSALEAFEQWPFLFDGARHHWRDHIDQPGSTGAAIDAE
jgi:hypothetical protein